MKHKLSKQQFFYPCLDTTVPTRTVHDPVLQIILQCEISQLTKSMLAKSENDARTCYDRILHSVASTISQLNKMLKTVYLIHANTLEPIKYYSKIMIKVSDEHYENLNLCLVYGTGKRSSNSPYTWLFINDIIFKWQAKYAHRTHYRDSESSYRVLFYVLGFVNDINLLVNNSWNPEIDVN